MSLSFLYLSGGKMFSYQDGKITEIGSGVLNAYINKVKEYAERNEWKYNGSGAAFTGSFQHRANPTDAVNSIRSKVNCFCEYNGDLIYSLDIDGTNGIYRKNPETSSEGIVLCNSSNSYRDFDLKDNLLVTSCAFAGESHIGVLNIEDKSFNLYTEGHCQDTKPVWSATEDGKIYFCSAGLPENQTAERNENDAPKGISQMVNEMYSGVNATARGPSAISLLDIQASTLTDVLVDDKFDFVNPQSTSDGSLYYIKKPYKTNSSISDSFGCLADLFLLPVRLFEALFGFLNVFSAKYSGKTLSRRDVKQRDEKEMFIEGNLINAEKALRDNQRSGDKNPGIIPHSWELRKLDSTGNDTLIKKGVLAYRVNESTGDIILSNGSSILKINQNGSEEKLVTAESVTFIK